MDSGQIVASFCIVCDLDGTLCDTNDVDDQCYRHAAAAALGIRPSEVDWTGAPHITDSGIAGWLWSRVFGRRPAPAEVGQMRREFVRLLEAERTAQPHRFAAVAGAAGLLEECRLTGITVSIGTGGWRASAELKLAAAGLPAGLLYATSDDAEARTEIFSLAWARAIGGGPQPMATILIGDGVWDLATARQLGWGFLGVGHGARAERLRAAGAAHIVSDYEGLAVQTVLQHAWGSRDLSTV